MIKYIYAPLATIIFASCNAISTDKEDDCPYNIVYGNKPIDLDVKATFRNENNIKVTVRVLNCTDTDLIVYNNEMGYYSSIFECDIYDIEGIRVADGNSENYAGHKYRTYTLMRRPQCKVIGNNKVEIIRDSCDIITREINIKYPDEDIVPRGLLDPNYNPKALSKVILSANIRYRALNDNGPFYSVCFKKEVEVNK